MFRDLQECFAVVVVMVGLALSVSVSAQESGSIRGTVTLAGEDSPISGAYVLVLGANDVVITDGNGQYEIEDLAVGEYEVLVQREHLAAERQAVVVGSGQTVTLDFEVALATIHEELTVTTTSSGSIGTALDAFNAVSTLDTTDIAESVSNSVAELLETEPGIAVRSFGPGSARPIIRGFDGDRVLVMEDGIRTGDLGSSSGEHGLTVDPNRASRVEVIRGPAALLYGSNAIGGVVNIISPQEQLAQDLPEGTRGHVGADAGSGNGQLGSSASLQASTGNVLYWGSGSKRRTTDYDTPLGTVENSASDLVNGEAGVGYFGTQFFANTSISRDEGLFGVPFAGEYHGAHGHGDEHDHDVGGGLDEEDELFIDLESVRNVVRADIGMHNLTNSWLHGVKLSTRMIDYSHDEVEVEGQSRSVGTRFNNKIYVMRLEAQQQDTGRFSGRFGVWGSGRDFSARGEEALAPDVEHGAFAAFAYEELQFGRHRVQLGGRFERNTYDALGRPGKSEHGHGDHDDDHDDDDHDDHDDDDHDDHDDDDHDEVVLEAPADLDRQFDAFTASLGYQVELGLGTSFLTSVTRSTRAPALEELYNFGAHIGSLTYEVGNSGFETEVSTGLDVGIRHRAAGATTDFNFYTYGIDNFIFLARTGQSVDSLPVGVWSQGRSRFVGLDAETTVRLAEDVTAQFGIGMVDATLTATDEALPRIPPLKGTVRITFPYKGFRISPEWVLAARQDRVYRAETATDSYSVLNVRASFTLPTSSRNHLITVSAFNLTNELYRNHTSFIKDLAPEIGRGVKAGYTLRFF